MICYFDGTYSQGMATGLTRYSDNLLRALDRHPRIADGEIQGVVFGFRGLGRFRVSFQNLETELIPVSVRANFYGNALFGGPDLSRRFRRPAQVIHYHDVFRFSADRPGASSVVTIHDVSSLTSPRHYQWRANWIKRRALDRLRHSQAFVVADSENTRREFLAHCPFPPERTAVVHLGVDEIFFQADPAGSDFLERRGLRRGGYALFVGRYHPRKNFEGILAAFRQWAGEAPVDMAFAGPGLGGALSRISAYRELPVDLAGRVKVLEGVSDVELAELYGGAHCLLYPSWHEGFGFPVVEAMAAGCPVICSSRGSLAEVAGAAAVVLEPEDVAGMARAVMKLHARPEWRRYLVERGRARAGGFTWAAAADKMVELFLRLGS